MIIDFEDGFAPEQGGSKRKMRGPIALSALVVIGALFLQNTLAANISIGTGSQIEFGQGVQVATACSGSNMLTVTPNSSFTNTSGAGAYYLKSVTVSGIPSSCQGVDFNLSFYDSSTSTALPIFATSKTVASIWNNAGTFQVGSGSVEATITSGSGTFTITFPTPVALASAVSRVTLQSTSHAAYSCAADRICNVGDISPSGGTIFYKSVTPFTETGALCGSNCYYLEWAPGNWNGGTKDSGVSVNFWKNGDTYVGPYGPGGSGLMSDVTRDEFGYGYANTNALIVAGDTSGMSTLVRNYAGPLGNTAGQWFVGSKAELYLARNNSSAYNGNEFSNQVYYASSQSLSNLGNCWSVGMGPTNGNAYTQNCTSNNPSKVRPFRAF
jgi:hypothetical protein